MSHSSFTATFTVDGTQLNILDGIRTRIAGKSVLITHGHNNDPSMHSVLSQTGVMIGGAIETVCHDAKADDRIDAAWSKLFPGVGPGALDFANEVR